MKTIQTRGIILSRTDYGEADRILTVLTPAHGKVRLMARGVRKAKSKLAGSIELFSTADITFIEGKGEIGTLISARLVTYYGRIVGHIERVQLGYELIKTLNRVTEDHPEPQYYELLEQVFAALDDAEINLNLINIWFQAQLLRLAGHEPNLDTDIKGQRLDASARYDFDFDSMAFSAYPDGPFEASNIKFLRLLFNYHKPAVLGRVQDGTKLADAASPMIRTMFHSHIIN